ncbi:aminotransferase class V-fold PLP-dependent enzyme [Ferrimonas senticii]|uniref:aminotransferase class V-fold PLP-dependent enzyme n=1 Tax=Ferrimonas senticii TaxID=394566 RepID=UPI00041E3D8A|nr:aminotransferase class V-fold PLP-dependent enzyme [Ferrimonas senticii]
MSSALTSVTSRRQFLKAGSGVAAAMALPSSAMAAVAEPEWRASDFRPNKLWQSLRREFILPKDSCYMNIGTTGSIPRTVLDKLERNNRLVARDPYAMGDKFGPFPHVTQMIADVAPGFGAEPHEIVLSRNTTDGICSIIGGLQFEAGDVVLTTHHEHIGLTSPLHVVSERYGVEVIELEIPVDTGANSVTEDQFVQVFADAVALYGSRVRLLAFSHITYKTGTTLPAKRICKEVAIPNQIPTLVDGAHGIGMLDLDFHDMDCDFYAGPGHKWQCGPGASGILYVRDNAERLKQFWYDRPQPLHIINSSMAAMNQPLNMQLQYVGNDNFPMKQALADVCKMWDQIGRDRIEQRVLELSARLKRGLAKAFPEAAIYSPLVTGLESGLTTINPFYDQADRDLIAQMNSELRERHGFTIRTVNFKLRADDAFDTHALRISTHLFHSEEEVDQLVKAMKRVYRQLA